MGVMARCAIHSLAGEAEWLDIWCAFNAGGLTRGKGVRGERLAKDGLGGLAVFGCLVMCT